MSDTKAKPIRLGLVGLGKIARDQHLPAIALTDDIELVAVASRNATLEGVACFPTIDALLASDVEVDAISLCTPPQGRRAQVAAAIAAGKHVMIEKPPGASTSEIPPLAALAEQAGVTLFATWHSRYAPAVEPARKWLAERTIRSVLVQWKEDVRHWHPGQDWIWEPGGFGVFDPAINALSIVTRILPRPFALESATLDVPSNRDQPVAAELSFTDTIGTPIRAELDFLQTGPQSWDIHVDTDNGMLTLSGGGKLMTHNGRVMLDAHEAEYRGLYRQFVSLVGRGESDVDISPLAHVADAFMLGRRRTVAPFDWNPA
ncbi:Gfo/Idh/MocA family protein [Lichenicola sp.]|uniref:Gfo/Idh/MocA family protein n=1 Tax=Lichenicola sp. TaxID=2804529 RepID=UPI003AFFF446